MIQQHPHRDPVAALAIAGPEPGEVFDDRSVEIERPALRQLHDGKRRERLRQRPHGTDRINREGHSTKDRVDAEGLQKHDTIMVDEDHRKSGSRVLQPLVTFGKVSVDILERRGLLSRRGLSDRATFTVDELAPLPGIRQEVLRQIRSTRRRRPHQAADGRSRLHPRRAASR